MEDIEMKLSRGRAWRRFQDHKALMHAYRVNKQINNYQEPYFDHNGVFHDWDMIEEKIWQGARHMKKNVKMCSCYMCGNPRKYWNEKTLQEVIHEEDSKEQLKDIALSEIEQNVNK